ncbi:Amidohydrolase 3 [Emticicia oligotrophica DSM 17448]|uniref:Amidohydrolase 3 n=1 Tax=Emticicia oligotrophica (strain DSM 17448 / CIP 109782 / MTCC 6937 / GPTSA100-15) TaxID=929562 RepID=A0ABN4ANR0_EMTOG|nr:amidohydrolase [Emticicia oligotrophica]AFK04065.1 Amidohydrolase 3 [Emticicia oligotrophica DSM 17448]
MISFKKTFFSSSLLFATLSFSYAQRSSADLIVHNAVVYTVDNQFMKAEAFAVKDGKFLATGTSKEILEKYNAKQKVDAKGKAVFPGLYDPHSHFMGLGQMLSQCDLVDTESYEEIVERLKKFAVQHPENQWIIGRGWDQNDWKNKEFPTKDLLDKAFPNKPVMLTRIDGHALLVNSKAISLAKISPSSKVDGGLVEVKNGQLTGILVDNAMGLVRRVVPKPTEAESRKMLLNAQKECFKNGLTTVSDAGLNQDDIDLIDKMNKEGSLKIRNYVMVSLGIRNLDYFIKKGIYKTDRLNVRSFKLYADGALGSRGACLLKPYSDAPDKTGFLLLSAAELERSLTQIYNSDFQANTHCIGDSANRLILDIYGKLLKTKNNRRWRIEHCQVVDNNDVPKFGQFSVIPSIQATHATSDMYWADERLGDVRVKTAYAFQDLLKQNGVVANGSDFPVEFVNPLYGFHSAVARQDAKNYPEGGFQMENALTREQALRAMTIWSAYANFEEKERGSIEAGKMADFVILEDDIMLAPKEKLRNVKVLNTFVGGEKVF